LAVTEGEQIVERFGAVGSASRKGIYVCDVRRETGLRDIVIVQPQLYPTVDVNVNRNYAGQFGLTSGLPRH
jgi:hypothetical protein